MACPVTNTAYPLYLSSTTSSGYPCTILLTGQGPSTGIYYCFGASANPGNTCANILSGSATVAIDYLDPTTIVNFVCQGVTGTVQVDVFNQKP